MLAGIPATHSTEMPPLYLAIRGGHVKVVEVLLSAGALLVHYFKKISCDTSVHYAAACGRPEVLPTLLAAVNVRYPYNYRGVFWNGRYVGCFHNKWPQWVLWCKKYFYGTPACWLAAKTGSIEAVEMLKQRAIDYLKYQFQGRTIFHFAALGGKPQMLQWLFDNE